MNERRLRNVLSINQNSLHLNKGRIDSMSRLFGIDCTKRPPGIFTLQQLKMYCVYLELGKFKEEGLIEDYSRILVMIDGDDYEMKKLGAEIFCDLKKRLENGNNK